MTIKTRFAPSPTGHLHIGGIRTAIFNWAFARRAKGQFYLRIDDTDHERNVREAYDQILNDIRWIGLNWDMPDPLIYQGVPGHMGMCDKPIPMFQKTYQVEWKTIPGIVYQSLRGHRYLGAAHDLVKKGFAYECFLTKEEIESNIEAARKEKRNYRCDDHRKLTYEQKLAYWGDGKHQTIRLNVDAIGIETLVLNDLLLGEITCNVKEIEDFVLSRPMGGATYALATSVDDVDMGITHIIRGQEHLTNTFKQLLLYYAMGVEPPSYIHIPFITAPNSKKKLSKRSGVAATLQEYREAGYLADALFNYLSHLGWSLDGKTEIWDREKFVANFGLDRMIKSSASFDPQKLDWVQAQYMSKLPTEIKADGILRHLGKNYDKNRVMDFVEAAGDRLKTFEDAREHCHFWDDEEFKIQDGAIEKRLSDSYVIELLSQFKNVTATFTGVWSAGSIQTLIRCFTEGRKTPDKPDDAKAAFKALIHALRVATTGSTVGIGLFEGMAILGQDKCHDRIVKVLEIVQD